MATPERVAIRQAQATEVQAATLQAIQEQLATLTASFAALHKKLDTLLEKGGRHGTT